VSGLNDLDPGLHAAADVLLAYATDQGYAPVITSTVRSIWQQLDLWNRYRAGRAQFPAAAPGRSAHQYGWAFDMALQNGDANAYADLGAVWQGWGGTWGAGADPVHFELPGASRYLRTVSPNELALWWGALLPSKAGQSVLDLFGFGS
jgi:hypothetical protein